MKITSLLIGVCLLSFLTGCHKPQVGEEIGAAEGDLKATALSSIIAKHPDLSLSDLKFSDIKIWALPDGKEQVIVVYAIPASATTRTEGTRNIVTTKVIGVLFSLSGKVENIQESTRSQLQ
jgi:hypothetical protein